MSKIMTFANLDKKRMEDAQSKMLSFAKNFDKIYPNLKNLRHFYSDDI